MIFYLSSRTQCIEKAFLGENGPFGQNRFVGLYLKIIIMSVFYQKSQNHLEIGSRGPTFGYPSDNYMMKSISFISQVIPHLGRFKGSAESNF